MMTIMGLSMRISGISWDYNDCDNYTGIRDRNDCEMVRQVETLDRIR